VADAVVIEASGGAAATTLRIDSSGTGASAIDINSAGGVDVDAVDDINMTSSAGAVVLVSNANSTDSIHLDANGGTATQIHLENSVGTGNQAIFLETTGLNSGIYTQSIGQTTILASGTGVADAINIVASGPAKSMQLTAGLDVKIDATNNDVILTSGNDIQINPVSNCLLTAGVAIDLTSTNQITMTAPTGIVISSSSNIDLTAGSVLNLVLGTGALQIASTQVVGPQGAAVADAAPAAGAPTMGEFNALVTQFNTLLARLRAATGHGLIA
jgi:hypothetical protein